MRTDYVCGGTNDSPSGCNISPNAANGNLNTPEDDVPPVFPVINAMVGLQVTPMDKLTINIEAGIRTFPYFGASAAYFF